MTTKKATVTKKKSIGPLQVQIVGAKLGNCGKFTIDKNTYYTVQNSSLEASAYKEKIVNWIGKGNLYLEKNGEVLEDEALTQSVSDIFKDATRQSFKDKYFTHHFCSGDIYLYPRTNMLGEVVAQVVDSRTIEKKYDSMGNIIKYEQWSGTSMKDIPGDKMYNSIVRYNSENPFYGRSLYQGIVYDSLSETESSKRQFYFFKNGAVPNAMFMLDPALANNKEAIKDAENAIKEKFSGSENAHKFMMSAGVKDVKILDLTNRDLDLLNLRNFIVKKRGVVFQIDPRIIGFMQDSGADRSMASIRSEASETINNLGRQFEDDLNNFYRMFVNKKADFRIKVDSEQFTDRNAIEEAQRKDVQLGLTTINEVRQERGLEDFTEEEANKPIISSSMVFLDQLSTQFIP